MTKSPSNDMNEKNQLGEPVETTVSGDSNDASPDPDRDDDDEVDGEEEETVEEKRQAAAEEHAEATSKHPPHGRL